MIGRLGFLFLTTIAIALAVASPSLANIEIAGKSILLDGSPFVVRGAAGTERLAELKALGANTVRTYAGDPGEVLDEAARVGLKVIVGLWLEHPRRGFDYRNRAVVRDQLGNVATIVRKYRDHPALLMWGIGNEVESELGDDSDVWPAVEEAAALVKSMDPRHPTMAVVTDGLEYKLAKIKKVARSIDVLGVNSYGEGVTSLPARARSLGWDKPMIVTELGPLGQWQAASTQWGAAIEPTSTEKAVRLGRYLDLLARTDVAGKIAFYWGQKQEVTPTWHSFFLPTGEWTQPVEVMAAAWGGRTPEGNRAPRIDAFTFDGDGRQGRLHAHDPDGDRLTVRWSVMAESTKLGKAGDPEPVPPDFSNNIYEADDFGVRIGRLPPGNYRLFVVVADGRGAAATANLPFQAP